MKKIIICIDMAYLARRDFLIQVYFIIFVIIIIIQIEFEKDYNMCIDMAYLARRDFLIQVLLLLLL